MNFKKPKGRSLTDFEPLRPSEIQLLDACLKGEQARLADDTPQPGTASEENKVRASFLRFLVLGGDEQVPVHERGVSLRGAFIEGQLDLRGCCIQAQLNLIDCHFDTQIDAIDAQLSGMLNLKGSQLTHGLIADRLRCSSSVYLHHVKATGYVRFVGAHIGGDLSCLGGVFEVKKGVAFSADGANIKGSVHLRKSFNAKGEVRFLNALIGGDLACQGGLFEAQEGTAFSVSRSNIKGSVFLSNGFKANGSVNLIGAQIGTNLDCHGGQFNKQKGHSLSAERANIKGSVYLRKDFQAIGSVKLTGAQIGSVLDCSGGSFEVDEGLALNIERGNIKGSVFMYEGFKAVGIVTLLNAQVGGDWYCNGGLFEVKKGHALSARQLIIKGSVLFSKGFKAIGAVILSKAQIGSDLDCEGGLFEVKNGNALSAGRINVRGSVLLRDNFNATGAVRLVGAQIGGNLDCQTAQIEVNEGFALSIQTVVVKGVLNLGQAPHPIRVNASFANVSVLADEVTSWAPGSLLDGFRYASLGGQAATNGVSRLNWLCMQPTEHLGETNGGQDFRPQPWRQVQRVLREMGHTEDAKQVGIAFEDRRRAIGQLGLWPKNACALDVWIKSIVTRGAHYIFGKLAGYGYRPIRLMTWMFAVWLLCGAAYWWLALPPRNAIAPSDPLVFQNPNYGECLPDVINVSGQSGSWYFCDPLRGEYATFSPLAFSLDLLLPVVDLGLEKTWGAFVPSPKEGPLEELFLHWRWGHAARLVTWFEILFGWLCSLLLVAIVSGYSRRNDEG